MTLIPRETIAEAPRPVLLLPVAVVEGLRDMPVIMNARTLNELIAAGLVNLRDFGVGEADGSVMTIEEIVAARVA